MTASHDQAIGAGNHTARRERAAVPSEVLSSAIGLLDDILCQLGGDRSLDVALGERESPATDTSSPADDDVMAASWPHAVTTNGTITTPPAPGLTPPAPEAEQREAEEPEAAQPEAEQPEAEQPEARAGRDESEPATKAPALQPPAPEPPASNDADHAAEPPPPAPDVRRSEPVSAAVDHRTPSPPAPPEIHERPARDTVVVAVSALLVTELQHWANHLEADLSEVLDDALRRHLAHLNGADGCQPARRHWVT